MRLPKWRLKLLKPYRPFIDCQEWQTDSRIAIREDFLADLIAFYRLLGLEQPARRLAEAVLPEKLDMDAFEAHYAAIVSHMVLLDIQSARRDLAALRQSVDEKNYDRLSCFELTHFGNVVEAVVDREPVKIVSALNEFDRFRADQINRPYRRKSRPDHLHFTLADLFNPSIAAIIRIARDTSVEVSYESPFLSTEELDTV